tara:strand:+ start:11039 stop:11494 length:456 start_codon:yes stop_codon:yes gene_type:complete
MKKIILIFLSFLLLSCNGYKPVYSSKGFNFYIDEIKFSSNDRISQKIIKKLKPYKISSSEKQKINLEIKSSRELRTIAKDAKGNDTTFEIILKTNIKVINESFRITNIDIEERFVHNNQTNKFELKQYRKNIEDDLINIIMSRFLTKMKDL